MMFRAFSIVKINLYYYFGVKRLFWRQILYVENSDERTQPFLIKYSSVLNATFWFMKAKIRTLRVRRMAPRYCSIVQINMYRLLAVKWEVWVWTKCPKLEWKRTARSRQTIVVFKLNPLISKTMVNGFWVCKK